MKMLTSCLPLVLMATVAFPWPARADDFDDLDIESPAPASAPSPAPAPGAAAAGAADDLTLETELFGGTPGTGGGTTSAAATRLVALDTPAHEALSEAWRTLDGLSRDRMPLGGKPRPPLHPWSTVLLREKVLGLLGIASPTPAPRLAQLIRQRLDHLAPTGEASESSPPAGDGAVTEEVCRDLSILDHLDGGAARGAFATAAERLGDPALASQLTALVAGSAALQPLREKMRALIHGRLGVDRLFAMLEGPGDQAEAAIRYVEQAAGADELSQLVGRLPQIQDSQRVSRILDAVGREGPIAALPDLDRAGAAFKPTLARQLGEAVGRMRQRVEQQELLSSGGDDPFTRRTRASRFNEAGAGLFRQGKFLPARTQFQMAVALEPSSPLYKYNLANTLYRLGNVVDAAAEGRAAITAGAEELPAYRLAIFALRDLGNGAELLDFLEQAGRSVRYSGIQSLIQVNLASEFLVRGQAIKALESVQMALSRAVPEDHLATLLAQRAEARILMGDTLRAEEDLNRARRRDPEHPRVRHGMIRLAALVTDGKPAGPGLATQTGPVAADVDTLGDLDLDLPPSASPPKPSPVASGRPATAPDLDLDLDL